MLLRNAQARGGFVVPAVARRKDVDVAKQKLGRVTSEALRKRDEADARVNVTLESLRSRVRLLEQLQAANDHGATGAGFARRFAGELRSDREARLARAANPHALEALEAQSNDFDHEFQLRALSVEARGRARDRIAQVGRMIDGFVSATKANPFGFEAHVEAAREGLAGLSLPKKIAVAFRERLSEIPRAALHTLAEEQPAVALDLIARRKGPADARFGIGGDVVRMLGKLARAKLEAGDLAREAAAGAQSTRATIDIGAAIDGYKRGERDRLSLNGLDDVGRTRRKALRDAANEARVERRRLDALAASVRQRLAAGKAIDPDDERDMRGLDAHFDNLAREKGEAVELGDADVVFAAAAGALPKALARKIAAAIQSEDVAQAAAGARLIEALEKIDPALVKRLGASLLSEAHDVIELAQAGFEWAEAVRLVRAGAETSAAERGRRAEVFGRNADGAAVAEAVSKALGAKIAAISDAA